MSREIHGKLCKGKSPILSSDCKAGLSCSFILQCFETWTLVYIIEDVIWGAERKYWMYGGRRWSNASRQVAIVDVPAVVPQYTTSVWRYSTIPALPKEYHPNRCDQEGYSWEIRSGKEEIPLSWTILYMEIYRGRAHYVPVWWFKWTGALQMG